MKKVAVYVDVQNVYYTVKQTFGCHFDYQAFWDQVTAGREVVRAFAYAIDRGDQKQIRFQQILTSIGFEVKLKPFIQSSDGSAKGDWDVGITLDMIEWANEIVARHPERPAILFGDADLFVIGGLIASLVGIASMKVLSRMDPGAALRYSTFLAAGL